MCRLRRNSARLCKSAFSIGNGDPASVHFSRSEASSQTNFRLTVPSPPRHPGWNLRPHSELFGVPFADANHSSWHTSWVRWAPKCNLVDEIDGTLFVLKQSLYRFGYQFVHLVFGKEADLAIQGGFAKNLYRMPACFPACVRMNRWSR